MPLPNSTPYSEKEERANAATHGVGIVLGVIGLVLISVKGWEQKNYLFLVTGIIFCLSIILTYTASTLYHLEREPKKRRKLKVLDHASIYVLIAGTYTPFMLVAMEKVWGWSILAIVWAIAVAGIIFKIFFVGRFRYASTIIYLFMGWLVVFAGDHFFDAISKESLYWLIVGGISFTIGTGFYLATKVPYHHAIWHCFVLFGSICHYIAAYAYLI